jgi:hypothetical protein
VKRLEEVVPNLPLGAVFTHKNTGIKYIFIGRTESTQGFQYAFQPEYAPKTWRWSPSTYANYETALQYFPELEKYVEPPSMPFG